MRMLLVVFLVCMAFTTASFSQLSVATAPSIRETEIALGILGDSIMKGSSDHARAGALAEFNSRILDLMKDPATFEYPFDSLKTVSKVKSKDGMVRIYTWILPMRSERSYQHFGLVQRINPKSKKMKLIGLVEKKMEVDTAESKELMSDKWFGAVYYDIIETKVKKEKRYVLLGWQGNDAFTNRKVIEILYFDEWDNITFGEMVFTDEKKRSLFRDVFEFTSQATMLLRYDKKMKMIVFDHLSPSSPSAKGQYRYYGPDFTYDGYRFKKGKWIYRKNLDLRNKDQD